MQDHLESPGIKLVRVGSQWILTVFWVLGLSSRHVFVSGITIPDGCRATVTSEKPHLMPKMLQHKMGPLATPGALTWQIVSCGVKWETDVTVVSCEICSSVAGAVKE